MRLEHSEPITIDDRAERRAWIEHRRDRLALSREAGLGRVSWLSVAGGVLAAYGAFAAVLGVVSAVLHAIGIDADHLSRNDWKRLGTGAGIAVAVVLFAAFLFGGYVAGRMARRAGFLHGLLVFVLGVVVLAAVAAIMNAEDGTQAVLDRLDSLGAPTSRHEWFGVVSVTGIAALAGMLVGGLLGGSLGERWHQRLVARALDPGIGPDAELRAAAARQREAADRAEARARKAGALTAAGEPVVDETQPAGGNGHQRGLFSRFRRHRDHERVADREIDLGDEERADADEPTDVIEPPDEPSPELERQRARGEQHDDHDGEVTERSRR
jgi:hypothetical protein